MYVTICIYPDGTSVMFNCAQTARMADVDHKDAVQYFMKEFISANSRKGFVEGYDVKTTRCVVGFRESFCWKKYFGDLRSYTYFCERGSEYPVAVVQTAFITKTFGDE